MRFYTNVPLDETISICADILFRSHLDPHTCSRTHLEAIHIASKWVQCSFNNLILTETSMVSPLGPALVNIFVGFQEERLFKVTNKLVFYKRYVYDTLEIFYSRSEKRRLFVFKQLRLALAFTCKFENNNSFLFLDIPVEWTNLGIQTSISRKPTFTDSYARLDSFCPRR